MRKITEDRGIHKSLRKRSWPEKNTGVSQVSVSHEGIRKSVLNNYDQNHLITLLKSFTFLNRALEKNELH